MMKILFSDGMDEKANLNVDIYFNHVYDSSWFDDEIVKKMVKDIDNTSVVDRNCMLSPVLGQIPPKLLSGGVKGLILLYKYDFYTDLIIFGDNCSSWLSWLSKNKDFEIECSGFDLNLDVSISDLYCINSQTRIIDFNDYRLKRSKYIRDAINSNPELKPY